MTEAAFAHADVEKVWLDVPGSGRRERGAMLESGNLREGDTLVLVKREHLGPVATIFVRAEGVEIETFPPAGTPKRPGAPLKFDPDPQQNADIKALWLNPGYTLAYVKRRASEIMGHKVERHHLVRAYKNRHKREQ